MVTSLSAEEIMDLHAKIYVAGHNGLVGNALTKRLKQDGFTTIITRTFAQLDLRNQQAVNDFFAQEKPDYVFLAAAKVGGIKANMDHPAEFMYDNLAIEINVIHAAYQHGVKKLLFLGSSCIYPRECPQPIKEEYLMSSILEPTNEFYAFAKIAGLKLCESYNRQYGTRFIACMPTNLYGPHDSFDLNKSHALPALLRKCYQAKKDGQNELVVWGSGNPYREFLYVDDLADACLFLMKNYEGSEAINVGVGTDVTIRQLAETIKEIIGFEGALVFDATKPDGTPRKLLNVDKLTALGWKAPTHLAEGIKKTLAWCKEQNIFT
jgi:Nucleoside-diphosphate-sugar epimerases